MFTVTTAQLPSFFTFTPLPRKVENRNTATEYKNRATTMPPMTAQPNTTDSSMSTIAPTEERVTIVLILKSVIRGKVVMKLGQLNRTGTIETVWNRRRI